MLSKETTMCAALITYLSARASYAFEAMEEKNIYGIFSKDTVHGTPSTELEHWYGQPVFELHHGFRTDSSSKAWQDFFQSMTYTDFKDATAGDIEEFNSYVHEKTEFIRIATWGSVDSMLDLAPLNSVSDVEFFEDYVENSPSRERTVAPLGLLANQLTQALDWAEMWADTDFTEISHAVFITDFEDMDTFTTREHRILDINAALVFHGLPSLDKLAEQEDKEDEKEAHWVSPILRTFIEEYLGLVANDPRLLRAVDYDFTGC